MKAWCYMLAMTVASYLATACTNTEVESMPSPGSHTTADGMADQCTNLKLSAETIVKSTQTWPVRIIAKVKAHSRIGDPSYQSEVSTTRTKLVEAMRRSGVRNASPVGNQPLVVLEVDLKQLEALIATGLVCNIFPDQPSGPH